MHHGVRCLIVVFSWLFVLNVEEVLGHGMLLEPVNRGSMWRKGYPTPINYDDNGNFCGGFAKQWYENDGKCGVCGDNYSLKKPRPNENTGTYGTGIIVATYEMGAWINLSVLITANHKGTFKFNICSLENDPNEIETEECFAKYPLLLDNGSDLYTLDGTETDLQLITVKLPESLKCERCVLRWHWKTGNNWGTCNEEKLQGIGALGCGPQEMFRTCSDISII